MRKFSAGRPRSVGGSLPVVLAVLLGAAATSPVGAQQLITQARQTIQVEVANAELLQFTTPVVRISLANPAVADVDPEEPNELVVRGVSIGTTTLFAWLSTGAVRTITIEVVPDIGPLQDQIEAIFPTADITVTTSGNAIILSGRTDNPAIVRRVLVLAQATGAPVINNIQAPTAEQILLHVRFAEIDRSALARLGSDLFVQNVGQVETVVQDGSEASIETLSEGIVRLLLVGQNARLDAVIRALRTSGEFRSLAEPNLLTLEGQEATFLAGGEFPFPTVQTGQTGGAGGGGGAVTIQFKEFGIRLRFTPYVTPSGTIRLHVAPEVSSLDFANGLTISGFSIPALLTRRTETEVELAPGEHLAIAGLLDNTMTESVDKIPLLGDLPILGALFRSTERQQNRTELLVLVTPYIVEPSRSRIPVPTDEPSTWRWFRSMKPDTTNRTNPHSPGGTSGNDAGSVPTIR